MLSIENLYWILYQNLLEPVGIDCWYYWPFGTTDNFCGPGGFQPYTIKLPNHVLFHFEQEPIYTMSLGNTVDRMSWGGWSARSLKILANSEKSDIKAKLCKDRHFLDWYFFFHGLAALDWYRDSLFIDVDHAPTKIYASLNHQVRGKRAYRMAITARLFAKNLHRYGDISLHADRSDIADELACPNTTLSGTDKDLINKHLMTQHCWPLTLDRAIIDGSASAHFGHREYQLWQDSFLHIVNETVFYETKLHLTEKIFKPIVSLRPFLLAAAPGNLAYLRSYGFETFDRWWDESYDSIQDNDQRLDAIVTIVENLCSKSSLELARIHDEMRPVLDHNKRHFFGEFRRIIVNEMIDNFDTCLRIWNNGRVDGRELLVHPDPESVKNTLLR